MKKICYIFIVPIFIILAVSAVWSQEKGAITQGDIAKLIGEILDYKDNYIINLKKIGITPLGEWNENKVLTKYDLDAILIRLSRRSPTVENIEPSKLLGLMGFPERDVSYEGIRKIFESDAFKRTTINSKLFLSGRIVPLPSKYIILRGAITDFVASAPAITLVRPLLCRW